MTTYLMLCFGFALKFTALRSEVDDAEASGDIRAGRCRFEITGRFGDLHGILHWVSVLQDWNCEIP